MTDREMLELAAKVAGHSLNWSTCGKYAWLNTPWEGQPNSDNPWNPLVNDEDAMRLAVKLRISVMAAESLPEWPSCAYVVHSNNGPVWRYVSGRNGDKYAATRQAIVRAAAEIGKGMK